MNRKLTSAELGRLLSRSAAQLDKETSDKLLAARHAALQHQQTTQQTPVLAWLNEHGLILHHPSHKMVNRGLAMLLAAVLLLGISFYWQHACEHDHSDIDIEILTDDLPVDMYVD